MSPDSDNDDEDNLPVPAGVVRVVLGLTMMVAGVLMLAIFRIEWGVIIFLLSPFVMLKRKKPVQ